MAEQTVKEDQVWGVCFVCLMFAFAGFAVGMTIERKVRDYEFRELEAQAQDMRKDVEKLRADMRARGCAP